MNVCLHVRVLAMCSSGGQKKASDPLNLELEVAVSCHESAGNRTWIVCKNSPCS